jgi:hypothetical protein
MVWNSKLGRWSWLVDMAQFSNSAFVTVWRFGQELTDRCRVGDCGIQHPSRYLVYLNYLVPFAAKNPTALLPENGK